MSRPHVCPPSIVMLLKHYLTCAEECSVPAHRREFFRELDKVVELMKECQIGTQPLSEDQITRWNAQQ